MALCIIAMLNLVSVKVINLVVLLATEDKISGLDLHIVENLVDVHVGVLIIRTGLDQ